MTYASEVSGYPCGGLVRALVADGVFVEVGSIGRIRGRDFPNYPVFDELLLTIEWENDTRTTVPCEQVERIEVAA